MQLTIVIRLEAASVPEAEQTYSRLLNLLPADLKEKTSAQVGQQIIEPE